MANEINIYVNKTDLGLNNVDNTSDLNKPISTATQTALNGKENVSNKENTTLDTSTTKYPTNNLVKTTLNNYLLSSLKGANNGLAELDGAGKVPSSQLPSYVDDVVEYANLSAFPVTGETGKIYIALDTNLTYRWGGTTYVEISPSLALGETSASAYRGDRGKIAYDHSQLTSGNPHNVTKSDVGLSNVDNTSDANKPISTATQTALNDKVTGATVSINNRVSLFDGTTGKLIKQSQIIDNGTNVGIGIDTPVEKLHVNGNLTADNYYINNVPYAIMPYRYKKNVASISDSGYTTLCNVTGTSLGSGVRLSIMGTTAGTVVSVVADILTSYLQDIYIESKAGIYSILTLKVISDDAENFTIQATTNSSALLTAEVEVYPLSSESIVFDPTTIYTGATLTHQCVSGFSISATGGTSLQNGNITTMGNITGSNLSGTNTGDQDLSSYATKNLTLDRKTASYTLVSGDNNKLIEMNVGTANNVTINNSVFTAGNQILVSQYGAGQVTFVAGAGVTLRSPSGKLKLTGQYSLATIICISASEFYISGDLTA